MLSVPIQLRFVMMAFSLCAKSFTHASTAPANVLSGLCVRHVASVSHLASSGLARSLLAFADSRR